MSTENNVNNNEETVNEVAAEEVQATEGAIDETQQGAEQTATTEEPKEDKNNLLKRAADKILGSGDRVAETVIEQFVEVEINNRVEMISKAIKTQDTMRKEFNKINRPNAIRYDVIDGQQKKVESYDDSRLKQIKESKEKLDKLTTAINNALNNNTVESYTKLKEALDKVGGGNKQNDNSGNNKGGNQ